MMKQPLKILFLANWQWKKGDIGAEYAFFKHFIVKPEVRYLGTFNIPLWTSLERRFLKVYLLQAVIAFFLSYKYDVVLAYASQSGLPLACLFRIFFRRKPLLAVFDVETLGRPSGWRLKLVRFAAARFDALVYASSWQKDFYKANVPEVMEKCRFIPLGIGRYDYRKASYDEPIFYAALGHHDQRYRDWRTLLLAHAKVADRIQLVIFGKEFLTEKERAGAPLPPNVIFVPYIPSTELAKRMANALFCVVPLPERQQSQGQLTALFCMALAKALIGAEVKGLLDYIQPNDNGLFYRTGDPGDLAEKIIYMVDHLDETIRMGQAGYEKVLKEHTEEIFGQRWEKILDELLRSNNKTRGDGN